MELNLSGPINQLGYGIATTNIFLELLKQGHDITLWPISSNIDADKAIHNQLRECIQKQDTFNPDADSIKIWHEWDLASFIGRGQHIGFPFFELNNFTPRAKHHIASCDKTFVASKWAAKIVENNTMQENIYVVPLGVDREVFNENILNQPLPQHDLLQGLNLTSRNNCVFLNIGKWEIRKGHDILLEAFINAFDKKDNVELWMMCDNPFLKPEQRREWENFYKDSRLGNKIRILPRLTTQREVAIIMSLSHCGVFPVRAEGWNLEALEMLSCGKNVIATNYSAHTEFLNTENSFLIDIDSLEPAFDGVFFDGKVGEWAKLGNNQLDSLVEHMRTIYKTHIFDINQKGIETAKKYTWTNTVNHLLTNIRSD